MRTFTRLSAVSAAAVLGGFLLSAPPASATEGFACPSGSDTIEVPYTFTADSQPLLAGTVCVFEGTTRFRSVDVAAGWSADVRSDGSKGRTEVRFVNAATGDRVELRYEPGRTVIK